MKVKIFFKPSILKIFLFLILMVGLNYYVITNTQVLDGQIHAGIPLGFYPVGSWYVPIGMEAPPDLEFSYVNFVLDIIFWYLVSCLVIFGINFLKSRKQD